MVSLRNTINKEPMILSKSLFKFFLLRIAFGENDYNKPFEVNPEPWGDFEQIEVCFPNLLYSEAATQRCSKEKEFWKYTANLQESTHAEVRLHWPYE